MRVLIVGGGIGGLTPAIALRQQGLRAEIVERARVRFVQHHGTQRDTGRRAETMR